MGPDSDGGFRSWAFCLDVVRRLTGGFLDLKESFPPLVVPSVAIDLSFRAGSRSISYRWQVCALSVQKVYKSQPGLTAQDGHMIRRVKAGCQCWSVAVGGSRRLSLTNDWRRGSRWPCAWLVGEPMAQH